MTCHIQLELGLWIRDRQTHERLYEGSNFVEVGTLEICHSSEKFEISDSACSLAQCSSEYLSNLA